MPHNPADLFVQVVASDEYGFVILVGLRPTTIVIEKIPLEEIKQCITFRNRTNGTLKCYLKLAATAKLDSLGVRVSSPQGRIPCSLNDNFYQNIIVLKFQSNADLTGATISLNYDRDLGHADYLVTNIVPDGGTIRANGVLVNLPDEYTNGRTY